MSADRNLLFGIFALQNDFVTRDQLVEAMNAWVLEKSSTLEQIFKRRGFLNNDELELLGALVRRQIARHGDVQQSLSSMELTSSVRNTLFHIKSDDVQSTLASAGHTFDPYASTLAPTFPKAQDGVRYQIMRPHAAGGLGEVFVAVDTELHREIALKQIQDRHADSPEARARFVVEAEVTGGLEHPGIVPVYGLGHYADGRPFYAMRFIRGDSLKESIERFHQVTSASRSPASSPDFTSLGFRNLLRRFLDVCNAIAYAHSRGVLHRDLKPGNIMLGKYGETLVVDWGLAKALGKSTESSDSSMGPLVLSAALGEGSSDTLPGAVIGTPGYMSPEQAAGRLGDLGPATDVYSLGATLYCLLAGVSPFHGKVLPGVLLCIEKGEFLAPNLVQPAVPGALAAICLKAMSLKPVDRYSSPLELAKDLECWLADEPVDVYKETPPARFRRFLRKRAALATGVAATLLVGLIGLGVGIAVVGIKNRALDASLVRETEQRRKAETNEALAKANEAKADTEFRRAKHAIDDYFTAVSESRELKEQYPGMQEFRLRLLEKAQKYYEDFLKERGDDPLLEADAALAFFNRALIAAETGRTADALAGSRAALSTQQKLVLAYPEIVKYAVDLATFHNNLGLLQSESGNVDEALANYRAALAIQDRLASEHLEAPQYSSDLATTHCNLGLLLGSMDRLDGALESHAAALQIRKKLAGNAPDDVVHASNLANSHNNLGILLRAMGKREEALTNFQAASRILAKVVRSSPHVSEYGSQLSLTYNNLGIIQRDLGKTDDALSSHKAALDILEKLARENPNAIEYVARAAGSHSNLGSLLSTLGKRAQARAEYELALGVQEKLVREKPGAIVHEINLGVTCYNLGVLDQDEKSFSVSIRSLDKAIQTLNGPAKTDAFARGILRKSHRARAVSLLQLNRFDEGILDFDAALKLSSGSVADKIRIDRDGAITQKAAYEGRRKAIEKKASQEKPQHSKPKEKKTGS